MPLSADRVKETTTTTGTGNITLAGAVSQFQAFSSAFTAAASSALIQYAIVAQSGSEWEVGEGQLTGSTTLTRARVRYSSNSNAAVNFSAGTKDVFATWTGYATRAAGRGHQIALSMGRAMP